MTAPGFEPRLLDYQSSVLTIILQVALYIATIYIFILYYFDVGMIIGLMLHPLRSLSLLLARRRDRSWFVRTAECLVITDVGHSAIRMQKAALPLSECQISNWKSKYGEGRKGGRGASRLEAGTAGTGGMRSPLSENSFKPILIFRPMIFSGRGSRARGFPRGLRGHPFATLPI